MKTIPLLSSFIAATVMSPALMAQFPVLIPTPVMVQPSAKLFSSNAVRAIFRGFKDQEHSPTLSDMLAPPHLNAMVDSHRIAIFEVIESLAYKRLSPYASQQLKVGDLFKVELDVPLMGQSADVTDLVKTLQVGEEVVAKIDELFVFDGQEQGKLTTPLVRMVRRNAPPASPIPAPAETEEIQAVETDANPAQPVTQQSIPLPTTQTPQQEGPIVRRNNGGSSSFVSIRSANGVSETVQVKQERDALTGEVRTRMFINGTEVDPETKQPLIPEPATPAPVPTAVPEAPSPAIPAPTPATSADSTPTQQVEPMPIGTTF